MSKIVKANIKTASEVEQFQKLSEKVQRIVVEKQKMEVDYGDIPDDFRG